MQNLGRRIRRWQPGVRHQVTWSGLAFSALIVMVAFVAFLSGNNLLFLLLAALLSTMLVSGLVSRLGLAGLEVRLLLPEHVFARRRLPARIRMRNAKLWMPSFSIHLSSTEQEEAKMDLYFPVIPGGATLEALTQVYFPRRGLYGDSHFQFTSRFPFGFTERRLRVRLRREVLVYPAIDPDPAWEPLLLRLEGDLQAHMGGRGHDFYRIRPYEASESARHVDWKSTAHTGQLQVREFAREQDQLVEVYLSLYADADQQEWFEKAVDCAAALCWRLAARNARLRFVTENFDLRLPEEGDVYIILKYLAQAAPLRAPKPVFPHEENSFKVVFCCSSQAASSACWRGALLVGRDALGPDAGSAQGRQLAAAGAQLDHRGRTTPGGNAGESLISFPAGAGANPGREP